MYHCVKAIKRIKNIIVFYYVPLFTARVAKIVIFKVILDI
jgi:hypothetical protein